MPCFVAQGKMRLLHVAALVPTQASDRLPREETLRILLSNACGRFQATRWHHWDQQ
jgi:hypothetical protein